MKFTYEDLSDGQFENLIVFLCQHLFGISVQGFAKGPDGGCDAKFVGTAELHRRAHRCAQRLLYVTLNCNSPPPLCHSCAKLKDVVAAYGGYRNESWEGCAPETCGMALRVLRPWVILCLGQPAGVRHYGRLIHRHAQRGHVPHCWK